jgi:ParB family chromosome partitioning protein
MQSIVTNPMSPAEAGEWKRRIGDASNTLRLLLSDGYERSAWIALGHNTWSDCLRSLADEYGFTERRLWQLNQANQIEQIVTEKFSVGQIPDSHLRPLASLEPETQRKAWQEAKDTAPNGKATAAHVETIVAQHKPTPSPATTPPRREYEAAVPIIAQPATVLDRSLSAMEEEIAALIEPEPRRAPRPLTDSEVEAVIWRGIEANVQPGRDATMRQKAMLQLSWLQTARLLDFSRMLNPGVSLVPDQLDRIKVIVEGGLVKTCRGAATAEPEPAPAIVEPEAEADAEPKDNDEYYTPSYILEPARQVLGSIDLDPASCAAANAIVGASRFYDKEINGLIFPWLGQIWLNPPYSDPFPWIERLFQQYEKGKTTGAMVLVNTANSPKWARLLWQSQGRVCLLSSRIKFWRSDRPEGKGFDRDQMIWYLGENPQLFADVFSELGAIR